MLVDIGAFPVFSVILFIMFASSVCDIIIHNNLNVKFSHTNNTYIVNDIGLSLHGNQIFDHIFVSFNRCDMQHRLTGFLQK